MLETYRNSMIERDKAIKTTTTIHVASFFKVFCQIMHHNFLSSRSHESCWFSAKLVISERFLYQLCQVDKTLHLEREVKPLSVPMFSEFMRNMCCGWSCCTCVRALLFTLKSTGKPLNWCRASQLWLGLWLTNCTKISPRSIEPSLQLAY